MKNFVKLIKQAHAERYSVVMGKILQENLPVAFISLAPATQAVEAAKTFRAQGLNIIALFVRENDFYPAPDEFEIISVGDAAKVFPQPEYIIPHDLTAARVAIKNFLASKVLLLGNDTYVIYETFMAHLDDLQEVYESLVDEESKKVFRGYWLGNISLQLGKIVYSNTPHYICAGFLPERGAVVIDGGTALRFSQMGYEVYGFEMDRENYEVARRGRDDNRTLQTDSRAQCLSQVGRLLDADEFCKIRSPRLRIRHAPVCNFQGGRRVSFSRRHGRIF